MEIYINALIGALSPQVVFALLGGLVGVRIKSRKEGYSRSYSLFIAIGSIIAVGATAEYFHSAYDLQMLFVHSFLGVLIGIMSANLLHAFNLFAPKFAKNIVNRLGEKLTEMLDKYLD